MSIESAKALIEKMKTDEGFRNKAEAIKDSDEFVSFAKSEGFDCTQDEIKQVSEELSDQELDAAAGGVNIDVRTPFGCACI